MDPNELLAKLVSGELLVVVQQEPTKPVPIKPKLVPEEQELADSLAAIARKYGKFNEDETGIWAGYEAAKDNVVAHIGVKCANCALYEGNGVCKIIAQKVEDGGKCRFAVIPDGVVGGVYDPAKAPVVPVSSGKRKIKVKEESTTSCPKATRDIATNLKNRAKAIKTAMYGPLNPKEPNEAFYKKLGAEWDVSADQARKQKCGNCSMFIVTPEMKSCIEKGVTGPKGKDEWEAIDGAGQLGYCEAFDFKCASERTCRAWVTGGPITKTKSVNVRQSVKALGATIGGNTAVTDAADMIDRDGDGTIFDGTPDEQPVKRKPGRGQPYERMDNSFLEKRRRRHVNRSLREQGITPTQGNQIQEMDDGSLQLYGRSDEEREARGQARADFTVEEDRKRFVNNQLRKRGIKPAEPGYFTVDPETGGKYWNAPNRSDEERQARREARDEYNRRMNAGKPRKKPSIGEPAKPPVKYPPGYVPGLPADRYPDPGAYVPGKPADRYPQAQKPGVRFPTADDARKVNERKFPPPRGSAKPSTGGVVDDGRYINDNPQFYDFQTPEDRQILDQRKAKKRQAAHDAAKARSAAVDRERAAKRGQSNRPASPSAPQRTSSRPTTPSREPRNLKERLVTNVFKDDDEDRGRSSDPYVRNPSNRPTAKMPVYRNTRPTAKMPIYEPGKQTGGGRFKDDDDRRSRPGDPPLRARLPEPGSPTQPITKPGMYGRPGDPPLRARRPGPGDPPSRTEMVPRADQKKNEIDDGLYRPDDRTDAQRAKDIAEMEKNMWRPEGVKQGKRIDRVLLSYPPIYVYEDGTRERAPKGKDYNPANDPKNWPPGRRAGKKVSHVLQSNPPIYVYADGSKERWPPRLERPPRGSGK